MYEFKVTLTDAGYNIAASRMVVVKAFEFTIDDGNLIFNARQGGMLMKAYAKGQWAHVEAN